MSQSTNYYPICPVCTKGLLVPVVIGAGEDKDVRYRCTEPSCGVRFDKHGYERFDEGCQEWKRLGR